MSLLHQARVLQFASGVADAGLPVPDLREIDDKIQFVAEQIDTRRGFPVDTGRADDWDLVQEQLVDLYEIDADLYFGRPLAAAA